MLYQIERIPAPGAPAEPLDPPAIFDNPAEAAAHATKLNSMAKSATILTRYKVGKHYPVNTDTDTPLSTPPNPSWHDRERDRFTTGHYKPVPTAPGLPPLDRYPHHFIHISNKTPSKIAYTPTDAHGHEDRTVAISPATYIARFYGDVYTPLQTAQFVDLFDDGYQLVFTNDPDEIERVYRSGPSSCMSHGPDDYSTPFHPVRVYGMPGSDLKLAYLLPPGDDPRSRPLARTLVWDNHPELGKVYGRRYSNDSDPNRFTKKLQAAGYRADSNSDTLRGAHIARVRHPSRDYFILPYVDYNSYVTDPHPLSAPSPDAPDAPRYLIIGDFPELGRTHYCQNTNGLSDDASDDDDEEPDWYCDHCNDPQYGTDSVAVDGESWCSSCASNHAHTCDDCDTVTRHASNLTSTSNDHMVCEDCLSSNYTFCTHCDEHVPNHSIVGIDDSSDHPICFDCVAKLELVVVNPLSALSSTTTRWGEPPDEVFIDIAVPTLETPETPETPETLAAE